MKVPSKAIVKYLARRGNDKGHRGRLEKKIFDFWLYWFGGDEAAAKKAMSEMRRKGFGELSMFIFVDEFEEWRKRERDASARRNWEKFIEANKKKLDADEAEMIAHYIEKSRKAIAELGFC